jgi:hypothetical protein
VIQQTTLQPVVETQYRQEQVVTAKSVVETHYRNEAYTETVPVTAYDTVTVDEGGYQQVWVPKLVCKQVPKTVYQQRAACRTVPFQVTKCVPEVSTRTVPVQTVRYVATTTPCPPANPCLPGTASSLSPLPALSSYPLPPASYTPAIPSYTGPLPAAPSLPLRNQAVPSLGPSLSAPATTGGIAPVPDPKFVDTPEARLESIPARAPYEGANGREEVLRSRVAAQDSEQIYRLPPPLSASSPSPATSQQASREPSKFVPAPSAATVWRTPRATMTR